MGTLPETVYNLRVCESLVVKKCKRKIWCVLYVPFTISRSPTSAILLQCYKFSAAVHSIRLLQIQRNL